MDDEKEPLEKDRTGWREKPFFNKVKGREYGKEGVQPGILRGQGPFLTSFDSGPY